MNFESMLNQIFQPYFYYSVISLVISFVCIKALVRFFDFMGQRAKSLLFLVPLVLPLIVMLIFIPSTVIQTTSKQLAAMVVNTGGGAFPAGPFFPAPPHPEIIVTSIVSTTSILSVTGIICIIGLIAGAVFATSMVLADDRLARKVLHVILLSEDEHQWLQAKIAESSKKLGIATPKIGVVEDLRPNAFTIGYGKRATLVFSVGLFKVLDKEEITAVAFHELAHVKNRDFFFKTLSSALTAISFFNPLSYATCSMAQREREMFADERAIELLEKPTVLGNAIAKICKAIQTLPKESMLISFSSNLLVTSSVLHRLGILSTHPRLDKRLRNISAPKPSAIHLDNRKIWSAFFLSILMISLAIVLSGAMINLQVNYTSSQDPQATPMNFSTLGYRIAGSNGTLFSPITVMVPFNASQNMTMPINQVHPVLNIIRIDNNAAYNVREFLPERFVLAHPQNETLASNEMPSNIPLLYG